MADWLCWCPDRGETRDDSAQWLGYDTPEEVAAEWGEQSDHGSADYDIVAGRDEPEVLVAPADGSAAPVKLMVTGESVPHYTARRVS